MHFSWHGFATLLEEENDFIQEISQGHSQQAMMRGRQDKESYWMCVMRFKNVH